MSEGQKETLSKVMLSTYRIIVVGLLGLVAVFCDRTYNQIMLDHDSTVKHGVTVEELQKLEPRMQAVEAYVFKLQAKIKVDD